MDSLISRQGAIDALRDAENHAFNSYYQGLVKAHKIIADLPSAQPERKRGRWIEYNATGKKQWMCSECCAEEKNPKVARYCYWCGAEMTKGEEDETD